MKAKKKLFAIFCIIFNYINSQTPHLVIIPQQCGGDSIGSILTIDGNGLNDSLRHSFDTINGRSPSSSLLQASDGKLYGITGLGGINGMGVLYKFDINTNTFTKLYDFSGNNGIFPNGDLIEAQPGKIFGITQVGGKNNKGVIYSYDIQNNIYAKLVNFDTINASVAWDGLCKASNGKLYGLTAYGGAFNSGVLYSFDMTNNKLTDLFDFNFGLPNAGIHPWGKLIQATDGNLYGLTEGGGINNNGTIFSFDISSNTYTKLSDLYFNTGGTSQNTMLQAPNGKLYFNLQGGSTAGGTLIEYDISFNSLTPVVNFSVTDGSFPGNLILASDGMIYGSTTQGGTGSGCSSGGCGTIYKYNYITGTFTSLYSFSSSKGCAVYRSISEYILNSIGLKEINESNRDFSIYPNPVSSVLNIKSQSRTPSEVQIISILGELVLKQPYSEKMDLSKLNPGCYFVKIGNSYSKFIKE